MRWDRPGLIQRSSTVIWNPVYHISCLHGCRWLLPCERDHRRSEDDASTPEAADLWMSFAGDCRKCVSVSLVRFNAAVFGTCGQVNETQWESTPPRVSPAGTLRVMGWGSALSLCTPPLTTRLSETSRGTRAPQLNVPHCLSHTAAFLWSHDWFCLEK